MNEKTPARKWLESLFAKPRSVKLWKKDTPEADQQIVLRSSIHLDDDEGLDFSQMRRDNIEAGLFYRVRFTGAWLDRKIQKLKGVFRK